MALLCGCLALLLPTSCLFTKIAQSKALNINLIKPELSTKGTYPNLRNSIKINVTSNMSAPIDADDPKIQALMSMPVNFTPQVVPFVKETTEWYMGQMDFDVKPSADYILNITIQKFQIYYPDRSRHSECRVSLTYSMTDAAGESILSSRRVASQVQTSKTISLESGFSSAFGSALEKIDWDKIADKLRASEEPKAAVKGEGTTALEHTVIRWFITSSPQGADVSWRVISSTPDVSNTNSSYLGTTPYESTESFDIRGLTMENAGNVQIEVSCERRGYLTQRKRFNLRQAMEQKEISAKFNLVEDN